MSNNEQTITEDIKKDKKKLFLYNELVYTNTLTPEEFKQDIENVKEDDEEMPGPGYFNYPVTEFTQIYPQEEAGQETKSKQHQQNQQNQQHIDSMLQRENIFVEYPRICKKYEEVVLEKVKNDRVFFNDFFESRYFKEDDKNDTFKECYESDRDDRRKKREETRSKLYASDVISADIRNDGWEGYGTKGTSWTHQMQSDPRKEGFLEEAEVINKIIDMVNWHTEVVLRQPEGSLKEMEIKQSTSVDYPISEIKHKEIRSHIVKMECEDEERNSYKNERLNRLGGTCENELNKKEIKEKHKLSVDMQLEDAFDDKLDIDELSDKRQPTMAKNGCKIEIKLYYLTSFCIKMYRKYMEKYKKENNENDKEKADKYREALKHAHEKTKSLSSSSEVKCPAVIQQIRKQIETNCPEILD